MDNYLSSSASYQMKNMNLNRNSYLMNGGVSTTDDAAQSGGMVGGLVSSEEIRVETFLLSADGNYIIAGSLNGPPQVWDIKVVT